MSAGPAPQPSRVRSWIQAVDQIVELLQPVHQSLGKQSVAMALADAGRHFDIHLDEVKEDGE